MTARPHRLQLLPLFAALVAVLLASGCRSSDEPDEPATSPDPTPAPVQATPTPAPTPTPEPYTGPEAGAVIELDGDVRIEVLAPGRGSRTLAEGADVIVRYTLFAEDGTVLEDSDELGGDVRIESLGEAHVFSGLDRALLSFHPGMKARVEFPAVGETGDTTMLTIEIEVIEELQPDADEEP